MFENEGASRRISVIVPMYNGETTVERCLNPLLEMRERGEIHEIIAVDDGSTDGTCGIVRSHSPVRLAATEAQMGPAAARNLGAGIATGTHLWFVDVDVVVAEDAARVLHASCESTGAAAIIGSYDDRPHARNFLSQYKNLVHHYYHHRGKQQASTFWAGCGAVERAVFTKLGGFDAKRYRYPSIEDIEFGYRLRDAGGKIVLEPALQGRHLKEWRLLNLVHTEIFRRALPWSRLMLKRKELTDDLNLGKGERARALLALATLASAAVWALGLLDGWVVAILVAVLLAANVRFLAFFVRIRGLVFAARALLFHQFYYVYSSVAFAVATVEHYLSRVKENRSPR